jgi:hypothetical protein
MGADSDDDVILTINDARRANLCLSGLRRWFSDHGLDFRTVIRDGISVRVLRETGDDAIIARIVALKKEADDGQRGR